MASTESGLDFTYHGDPSSSYPLANHGGERERLHVQHEAVMAIMQQQPVHAPIEDPKRILDIGCGVNADMTIYLARKFPSAKVYGVDLSKVDVEAPNNVEFIQGNIRNLVNTDKRLQAGTVDYIFSRFMVAGVTDWPGHIADMTQLLAPDGVVELHDAKRIAYYDQDGEVLSKAWKWLQAIHKPTNDEDPAPPDGRGYFRELLQGNGVSEVHEKLYRMFWSPSLQDDPVYGPWARYGASPLFIAGLAPVYELLFPGDEMQVFRQELLQETRETLAPREGLNIAFVVVYGRKGSA